MTALPASLDLLSMEHAAAPESAEQQKIRAAQAGDMAAFEWLVQQHEERLFLNGDALYCVAPKDGTQRRQLLHGQKSDN